MRAVVHSARGCDKLIGTLLHDGLTQIRQMNRPRALIRELAKTRIWPNVLFFVVLQAARFRNNFDQLHLDKQNNLITAQSYLARLLR